jgi:Ca2+-binding EF-hand superfamily protein
MFEDRDKNKDGKLSGDEISEQMAGRLEQIDTDKDGSVSRAEMEKMMSRMRQRGGGDRAGRGGSEGGGRPGGDRPRRPEAE